MGGFGAPFMSMFGMPDMFGMPGMGMGGQGMSNGGQGTSYSYSSSYFSSGGDGGTTYESTESMRRGPGGVRFPVSA